VAKKNKTPQKFLLSTKSKRKTGEIKDSSEEQTSSSKTVPKWKLEREAFIAAMRIGKQIDQLENDPTINKNDLENKISNLTSQIPS
jgi:hypothetical protein